MKNFEDWFKDLISDLRWFELLRHYREETIRKAAQNVFAQLVADNTVDVRPMPENRKHVYNICIKGGNGDKVMKPWHVQEAEKKEEQQEAEWVPVSEEERARRLAEFKAIIDSAPIANYRPPAKEVFYGKPVEKLPPYPVTPANVIYEKDRHIEYLRHSYHPLTREKLPGWMPETEFNDLYDQGLI